MTKADIVKKLIESFGYTEEHLAGKSKAELEIMLDTNMEAEALLTESTEVSVQDLMVESVELDGVDETPEIQQPEESNEPVQVESVPSVHSKEWQQYVMSQFLPEELDGNLPKADGLRRIAFKLLGPFSIDTDVIQCPEPRNNYRATVKTTIHFVRNGTYVSSVADCYAGNTDMPYALHLSSTAATRSEGRCFRKALMLNQIICSEEICSDKTAKEIGAETQAASSTMIEAMKLMCKRHGINYQKIAILQKPDVESVEELSVNDIKQISEMIHEYDNGKEIPENIKI